VEGSKIARGKELIQGQEGEEDNSFIFTPHVRANMALLASVVSTGKFPVLMEGETSAGKTSMIIQLAKMSGNRVYRINNHEHTDIQVCQSFIWKTSIP
jgi:midasin